MIELNAKQIEEYFHRSYSAVDGLWFMKVEERYGFDTAIDIDNDVWKVFPKIQARLLKSMGKLENGMYALFECLTTKLNLEGFEFHADELSDSGFKIAIKDCPWHNLMLKSGRGELSGKVGAVICNAEYSAWASEFGDTIKFELAGQICEGSPTCNLQFDAT
jgi:hypothetical protein